MGMCIDYRELNKETIKNKYLLLRIDDLCKGIFVSSRCVRVNYQRPLFEHVMGTMSSWWCRTDSRMPLQCSWIWWTECLRGYVAKSIIIFIDNILVYSHTVENHELHLKIVLGKLREKRLYAKFSKCEFSSEKLHFWGHVASEEGSLWIHLRLRLWLSGSSQEIPLRYGVS